MSDSRCSEKFLFVYGEEIENRKDLCTKEKKLCGWSSQAQQD